MTRPTLINLNLDTCNQGLHNYPFVVNSDRYNGICSTLNYPSNRIYVPNKIKEVNLSIFNMITGTNESKT